MSRNWGARRQQNQGPPANQIGSAWIKETKDGVEYISISFNENIFNFDIQNCFVDMYPNEYKQKDTHPDYVVKVKEKQQQQRRGPAPRSQQRQQAPRPQAPRPRNFAPQRTAPASEAPMPENESDAMGSQYHDDGGDNY